MNKRKEEEFTSMAVIGELHSPFVCIIVAHIERMEIGRLRRCWVQINGRLLRSAALVKMVRPIIHTFPVTEK